MILFLLRNQGNPSPNPQTFPTGIEFLLTLFQKVEKQGEGFELILGPQACAAESIVEL